MIAAAMPVGELHRLAAEGEPEQLVPQADPEDRERPVGQLADRVERRSRRRRGRRARSTGRPRRARARAPARCEVVRRHDRHPATVLRRTAAGCCASSRNRSATTWCVASAGPSTYSAGTVALLARSSPSIRGDCRERAHRVSPSARRPMRQDAAHRPLERMWRVSWRVSTSGDDRDPRRREPLEQPTGRPPVGRRAPTARAPPRRPPAAGRIRRLPG